LKADAAGNVSKFYFLAATIIDLWGGAAVATFVPSLRAKTTLRIKPMAAPIDRATTDDFAILAFIFSENQFS